MSDIRILCDNKNMKFTIVFFGYKKKVKNVDFSDQYCPINILSEKSRLVLKDAPSKVLQTARHSKLRRPSD